MDYAKFAETFEQLAAIVAVELKEDGAAGEIRLEACNELYKEFLRARGVTFVPGMIYTDAVDRDLNFESMCHRCVKEKQPLHSYVNAPNFDAWLSIFMMPVRSEKEGIGYCLFSFEMTPMVEADKLADTSAGTAEHVLQTCIRLRETDDFREAMNSVIGDIRKMCESDHCCILLTDFHKRTCSVLCESIREGSGLLPMDTYADDRFIEIAESWIDTIGGSNCVSIADEHDMNRVAEINPRWVESLRGAHVNSVVLYPLKTNNEILGFIWAINFDTERALMIKEILEVTKFILSAEVANWQLFERTEMMSRTDLMTGVLNRNAMNKRMDDLGAEGVKNDLGIVYADLNGLKAANDNHGHAAGDRLLKDAAFELQTCFGGYEVFRAGGDEFIVIAEGIARELFEEKVRQLRALADGDGVGFSVGACFACAGDDIMSALQEAEHAMYRDKADYYRRHPERSRRAR